MSASQFSRLIKHFFVSVPQDLRKVLTRLDSSDYYAPIITSFQRVDNTQILSVVWDRDEKTFGSLIIQFLFCFDEDLAPFSKVSMVLRAFNKARFHNAYCEVNGSVLGIRGIGSISPKGNGLNPECSGKYIADTFFSYEDWSALLSNHSGPKWQFIKRPTFFDQIPLPKLLLPGKFYSRNFSSNGSFRDIDSSCPSSDDSESLWNSSLVDLELPYSFRPFMTVSSFITDQPFFGSDQLSLGSYSHKFVVTRSNDSDQCEGLFEFTILGWFTCPPGFECSELCGCYIVPPGYEWVEELCEAVPVPNDISFIDPCPPGYRYNQATNTCEIIDNGLFDNPENFLHDEEEGNIPYDPRPFVCKQWSITWILQTCTVMFGHPVENPSLSCYLPNPQITPYPTGIQVGSGLLPQWDQQSQPHFEIVPDPSISVRPVTKLNPNCPNAFFVRDDYRVKATYKKLDGSFGNVYFPGPRNVAEYVIIGNAFWAKEDRVKSFSYTCVDATFIGCWLFLATGYYTFTSWVSFDQASFYLDALLLDNLEIFGYSSPDLLIEYLESMKSIAMSNGDVGFYMVAKKKLDWRVKLNVTNSQNPPPILSGRNLIFNNETIPLWKEGSLVEITSSSITFYPKCMNNGVPID